MTTDELRAAWRDSGGRCQAVTAKGRPCGNASLPMGDTVCGEHEFALITFEPGYSNRCRCHQHDRLAGLAADPRCRESVLVNVMAVLAAAASV